MSNLKNRSNVHRFSTNKMILSLGIFMRNIKALALTVQNILARIKFSKKWVKLQGQGHRVKHNGTHSEYSCEISKL